MREKSRREQTVIQEQGRRPDGAWSWLQLKPNAIDQVAVGRGRKRFVSEAPVDPFGHYRPLAPRRWPPTGVAEGS
jgi:hypothetical protein